MPSDTDPGRTYTDREVRLILKSAVELQQRRDQAADPSGGMSLAELEQVAVEAGLEPALIRRAAVELDTVGPPPDRNAFLGSPTHVVIERVADAPIHPESFDQLLDVTRAVTHEVGEVVVGSGYLWSRWGLKRDATRYAARARELVDALAERTRAVAAERDRIDADRPANLPNA